MSNKVNFENLCKEIMATSERWGEMVDDECCFLDFQMELLDGFISDIPDYRHIEQKGSGEWEYDCYTVFEWKGQMYKYAYKYLSHSGYELDYIYAHKVKRTVKEVVVYE